MMANRALDGSAAPKRARHLDGAIAMAALSAGCLLAEPAAAQYLTAYPSTYTLKLPSGTKTPGNGTSPATQESSSREIHNRSPFQVCFFSGVKFTGQSFCVDRTERIGTIEKDWRNRIRSIKVAGEKIPNVEVCSRPSLDGQCEYVNFYKEQLPEGLSGHVYSYRIR